MLNRCACRKSFLNPELFPVDGISGGGSSGNSTTSGCCSILLKASFPRTKRQIWTSNGAKGNTSSCGRFCNKCLSKSKVFLSWSWLSTFSFYQTSSTIITPFGLYSSQKNIWRVTGVCKSQDVAGCFWVLRPGYLGEISFQLMLLMLQSCRVTYCMMQRLVISGLTSPNFAFSSRVCAKWQDFLQSRAFLIFICCQSTYSPSPPSTAVSLSRLLSLLFPKPPEGSTALLILPSDPLKQNCGKCLRDVDESQKTNVGCL